MKNDQDQWLLLDCQLCFPLYACARKIVAAYHPYLKKIGLTYTQYITMMVLWQEREISVKDLGTRLYLDSGTLTPVLKTLERQGYVARTRSKLDERVVVVLLTEKGAHLKEKAPFRAGTDELPAHAARAFDDAGRSRSPQEKAL